jgi:cell shape-determining protein MreC
LRQAQTYESLCSLQGDVSELWAACSDQAKNTQDLKKSNREQKQEIAGLPETILRISEESQSLREELAGLRRQQDFAGSRTV